MKLKIVNRRIIDVMKKLDLPTGEYAVFGSGLLDVLGIRASRDIDLILTRKLYEKLAADGWEKFQYDNGDDGLRNRDSGVYEAFYYCTLIPLHSEEDIKSYIKNAVMVDGVSFASLDDTLLWKSARGQEKDLRDVKLIKEYLVREGAK
ncbi:MAG: hypothetical protein LBU20_01100 [Candidatus Nomurabacteria bacterium]|jgi:hypothetical protein|nr:hypothetical protein [Candidatus Nomurabacteria bacterium]